ncbi:hypothetical protein CIB84_000498 [Bambusicola thoracicus]|uniref:Uncharacterized protein n=1 Tax=Bambusicola thoracicus TaxID=9083 RepID=A0A2P4THC1_BAMTH|nr:hypothetical protein CIB84_000498 [Bambusicola thoracicus]
MHVVRPYYTELLLLKI